MEGVVCVGERSGEERKRKANGLAGDGAFDRNTCGGCVDGFVGEALGVGHRVGGLRECDLLGGLIGAAGENADGAGGRLLADGDGDVSRGDGVRGDRSAHGAHGGLQESDGLRVALDSGSGLLRRGLGRKKEKCCEERNCSHKASDQG